MHSSKWLLCPCYSVALLTLPYAALAQPAATEPATSAPSGVPAAGADGGRETDPSNPDAAPPAATETPEGLSAEPPSAPPAAPSSAWGITEPLPPSRPQPLAEPSSDTVVSARLEDRAAGGAYYHDGFYVRAAIGFSGYTESLRSNNTVGGDIEGNTTGIANVNEFALGGTIGRGFVLGGAIYATDLLAATFRTRNFDDEQPPPELDPERRSLVFVGPFADWYLEPEQGWHVQGALGLSVLAAEATGLRSSDESNRYRAIGGGVLAGIGYEWFVGPELSVGLQGRVMVSVTTGKDEQEARWINVSTTSPAFLLTGTYH